MEEDKTMSTMMMGVGAMMAVLIGFSMVQASTPEVTYYSCPLCDEQFTSIADLEEHFASEHPAEDIDIIWE